MSRNLTATILIIAAFGIYATVTKGMLADAGTVKAQNALLANALTNAGEIVKARDQVTASYNSIPQADRDKLDKMIPSTVDNIRLVIDLDNLALQNRFALSDVKAVVPSGTQAPGGAGQIVVASGAQQSVSEPTLDKVQVSFSATASYQQFIQFMQAVESDLRIMDLTKLTMAPNDTGTYDFGVTFQTYWLRQ